MNKWVLHFMNLHQANFSFMQEELPAIYWNSKYPHFFLLSKKTELAPSELHDKIFVFQELYIALSSTKL
jgi:hypothetical protein